VVVRRDELETNVIFVERLFEFLRAFVVKNVGLRGISMHLEPGWRLVQALVSSPA
jgi:hypothetical protein